MKKMIYTIYDGNIRFNKENQASEPFMAPGLVVRSAVFTLLSPGSWEMANSTAVFVVRISYIYFEFASSDGPPCDAMKVYYSLVVRPLPPPGILRLMLRAPPRVLEYAAWIFYHESRSW